MLPHVRKQQNKQMQIKRPGQSNAITHITINAHALIDVHVHMRALLRPTTNDRGNLASLVRLRPTPGK